MSLVIWLPATLMFGHSCATISFKKACWNLVSHVCLNRLTEICCLVCIFHRIVSAHRPARPFPQL